MKFIAIFSLLLVALVGYTSAQDCSPGFSSCSGPRDVGRGGPGCTPRTRYHYDPRTRQCNAMRYLGCGGNRNRWCTRAACMFTCRR